MKHLMNYWLLLFGILPATVVCADDSALYRGLPPADAAFFRFVNADREPVTVLMDGNKIAKLKFGEVSAYGFVSPSKRVFTANETEISFEARPDKQVSIVLSRRLTGGYTMIEEELFNNKRKARIKLFNLDEQPISLKTGNGKVEVISAVSAGDYGRRDVNALRSAFSVHGEGGELFKTDALTLKRDKVASVFFFPSTSGVTVTTSESEQ